MRNAPELHFVFDASVERACACRDLIDEAVAATRRRPAECAAAGRADLPAPTWAARAMNGGRERLARRRVDGVLLLDKPAGVTSNAALQARSGCRAAKAGHTGTLDPLATGLLPLCSARRPSSAATAGCRQDLRAEIAARRDHHHRRCRRRGDRAPAGEWSTRAELERLLRRLPGRSHAGPADVLGAETRRPAAVRVCARRAVGRRGRAGRHDPRAHARRARGGEPCRSPCVAARGPTSASSRRTSAGARLRRPPRARCGEPRSARSPSTARVTLDDPRGARRRAARRSAAAGRRPGRDTCPAIALEEVAAAAIRAGGSQTGCPGPNRG